MKAYNGFPGEYRASQYERLKTAWRNGTRARPASCTACGQTGGSLNAHHEDYSTPLDYDALCCVCHLMVHCRFNNRAAWLRYCDAVRAGYQPPATNQQQAMRAVRTLTGTTPDTWPGEWSKDRQRAHTVLDTYPLTPIIHPNAQPEQPELPM